MTKKKPTKSRFAIYRDRKAAELLALKEEIADKNMYIRSQRDILDQFDRDTRELANRLEAAKGSYNTMAETYKVQMAAADLKLAKKKKSAKHYKLLWNITTVGIILVVLLAGMDKRDLTQEADRWKRNSVAISSAYDTLAKQERWDTVMPPDLEKRMVLTYGFRQDSVWRSYDTGQEVTVLKWRPKN